MMTDAANSDTTIRGRLIPPPELAPGPPKGASREDCIAMWFDLVEATDQILLAALRSRCKTEAEVAAAYRESYARWVEEHDKKVRQMMTAFDRNGRNEPENHGG